MPAQYPRGATRRCFRTLFVSDVHLGCRYAQAEKFLAFLEQVQPEHIYIVGDFIDGWRLCRRWHWQPVYVRILQRLVQLASQGTQVYYAPGNHDEFLRDYLHDFGLVTVADQFIHRTADGRRFVVLHGDQFDDVERGAKWLSVVGAFAYDRLVSANGMINQVRRCFNMKDWRFSSSAILKSALSVTRKSWNVTESSVDISMFPGSRISVTLHTAIQGIGSNTVRHW